eukprot:gene30009-52089_t
MIISFTIRQCCRSDALGVKVARSNDKKTECGDEMTTITRRGLGALGFAGVAAQAWAKAPALKSAWPDATETAAMIRGGQMSALEAARTAVDCAQKLQPKLNFLVASDFDRALERGEAANLGVVQSTWFTWQRAHRNKWGNDYWCLVQFGALLALASTGWVITSAAFITLLAPVPIATPLDFIHHVVLAKNGVLFEAWLALGGVLAAPIFASTAIAVPLLLDRRVSLYRAVLLSWHVVLANPLPMALWA